MIIDHLIDVQMKDGEVMTALIKRWRDADRSIDRSIGVSLTGSHHRTGEIFFILLQNKRDSASEVAP